MFPYAQSNLIDVLIDLNHGISTDFLTLPADHEILSETVFMTSHLGYEPDTSIIIEDDTIGVFMKSNTKRYVNLTSRTKLTSAYYQFADSSTTSSTEYIFNDENKLISTISGDQETQYEYMDNGYLSSAVLLLGNKTYPIIQSVQYSNKTEYQFIPGNLTGGFFDTARIYMHIENGEAIYSDVSGKNESLATVDLWQNKLINIDNCHLQYSLGILTDKICPNEAESIDYDYNYDRRLSRWKNRVFKVDYVYLDEHNYFEKAFILDSLYQINKISTQIKRQEDFREPVPYHVKKYPKIKIIPEENYEITYNSLSIDFGTIKADEHVRDTVNIYNDGEIELKIINVTTSNVSLSATILDNKSKIPPGEFTSIELHYNSLGKLRGDRSYRNEHKRVNILTNSEFYNFSINYHGRIER